MTPNELPPAEYLRATFSYCMLSGRLYWRERTDVPKATNTRFAGAVVGTPNSNGLTVRLNNKSYAVHRIIYVMLHGNVLTIEDEIDHKDLDNINNRGYNIRKASNSENGANKEKQSNNTSGSKSIDQLPGGRFRARIAGYHVGVFDSIEEATFAYKDAAERIYGEFGRASLLQTQI